MHTHTRLRNGAELPQLSKETVTALHHILSEQRINMETETQRKIEETVRRILEESDMDQVTESKIRKQASQELDLDLSKPPFKAFVKQVVESFLEEQQRKEEEEEAQQQQEEPAEENQDREYDDNGDLVICRVGQSATNEFLCWVIEKEKMDVY